MIILYHPRATRPRNRRLPLAVMALAAVLFARGRTAAVDPAPAASVDESRTADQMQ